VRLNGLPTAGKTRRKSGSITHQSDLTYPMARAAWIAHAHRQRCPTYGRASALGRRATRSGLELRPRLSE